MHALTVAGAAQVEVVRGAASFPVSRSTACQENPHASTKTRASVGAASRRVKAARPAAARDGARSAPRLFLCARATDAPARQAPASALPAPSAVLSYARVRCPQSHSRRRLNGKQGAARRQPVLSPQRYAAGGSRKRDAQADSSHCRSRREGVGMTGGQPGYRPTQTASPARRTWHPRGTGAMRNPHRGTKRRRHRGSPFFARSCARLLARLFARSPLVRPA